MRMTASNRVSGDRRGSREDGGFRGLRLIWRTGGRWERFFLLCPLWWGIYMLILLVVSSPVSGGFARLLVVGFSFGALLDVWLTPVFSSTVLRASLGTGLNRDDENARLFAEYLDSLGQEGRWRFGNLLSLAYLGVMFGWGAIAVAFTSIAGMENSWAFYPLYLAFVVVLWSIYRLLLRRLVREARRAGYPIQHPGRSPG